MPGVDRFSSPLLQPGTTLGRCVITSQIAQGAFGRVYAATHQTLGFQVAVKVLHPAVLAAPGAVDRFRTEARSLAQLNHPHVVRLWDFEDSGNLPYLVMEYVPGTDLGVLIAERGRMPAMRALRFIIQVTDALFAAFRIGVVHRDIKPANLLLTQQETVKVSDLGMAVVIQNVRDRALKEGQPASVPRGTAAYIAPEQASMDANADHRADMYSLGVTFFHLLTGRLPFAARTPLEMVMRHLRDAPPAANSWEAEVPAGISLLVQRLMAKDPDHRFRTYDELRDALIDLELELSAPPASPAASTAPAPPPTSLWRFFRRRPRG